MSKKRVRPKGICPDCGLFRELKGKRCNTCGMRKHRAEAKLGGVYVPAVSTTPLVSELLTLDAIDELLARPGLIYTPHANPFPNCVRTTALDPATGETIEFLALKTPGKEAA